MADVIDENWPEDIDLGSDLNVGVTGSARSAISNRVRSRILQKGLSLPQAPTGGYLKNKTRTFKIIFNAFFNMTGNMKLIELGRKIFELKMEPKTQGQDQTRLGTKPCGPKTILDGNRRDSNSTVSCYGTMSQISSRRNSQASQVRIILKECVTNHFYA